MRPIPLPTTDAVLRLSLPFPGLSPVVRVGLALLLLFALVALFLVLYRAEARLVPRRFAVALLGLRVSGVVAVFLLLALDPVIARSVKEEVPGRVLIAVDRSDSMAVTDPNRPLADKIAYGRLLKLTTDLASERDHESWERMATESNEVRFGVFGGDEEKRRFDKVMAKMNATPRLTVAARVLTADGLGLVDGLKKKHAVDLVGFGQEVTPLPADGKKLAAVLDPATKRPAVGFTDLKLPLARASETAGDDRDTSGTRLLGVVLLTDGRHNWGDPPISRARELGGRQVPVFPVVLAPKDPPADVAIVAAQAQASTVFKGSIVPVEASVRITGWPKGNIKVTMSFPDNPDGSKREPLTQSILHTGKDATVPVTFKAKMDTPGPQPLTVVAEPEGDATADRFPENNRRTVRVNVVKDRAKVMLIDGEARWEFHYLHTCLGRDPNMDVRSVVFRQPRIDAVRNEDELRKSGYPALKLPEEADILTAYDCVILGDVEANQLPAADRERIEKYVAEAGGTLVLIAGKRAMPTVYAATENDPLRKLLPIKNPTPASSDDGFQLAITPEGDRSWFLAMGDTPAASRDVWDKLPRHSWSAAGELKDGAECLATLPGGDPRKQAVIARQSYGFGRVLYVGIDSTWRWRFKAGDYYHHRFWGQVAQWAASDRLLPVTNAAGTIRFGTREPVFHGGQDVEVIARTAEGVKKLGPNALKGARIIRLSEQAGGKETSAGLIPLTHPDGRPRDLSGRAKDLPPGKYAVELEVPDWADELLGPPGPDGRATRLRCPFEILPPDNEELVELSANLPLLEEIAATSGGKVYTVQTVEKLIDELSAQAATREYFVERPVRQSWWVFGVLLALLTLEWGLRKWAGLP